MFDPRILSGPLLGWGLGANDAANIFGTAVTSRMVRYSTAIILTALFILLGALLQGQEGMETLSSLTPQAADTAFIASLAAGITVILMTILKLPISTSQAVVGAILGVGFASGSAIDMGGLLKIVISWLITPVGAFVFTIIFYQIVLFIMRRMHLSMAGMDSFLRWGLLVAGAYGAYALGANNVANVTGVYAGNLLTVQQAVVVGGISIALGVLTYSKNVMMTVGKGIVPLDPFSAFITVIATALTVHIFAMIGVPVSSSQAIVGAVVAIGVLKNIEAINYPVVIKVFSGWLFTPTCAFIVAYGILLIRPHS